MAISLTKNAIEMICNGQFPEGEKPIVQVTDIKLLTAGHSNTNERYRLLLSDGTNIQQGMLATQMNGLVHSGELQKGSIVQLVQYVSQIVQTRKIIIIISLSVIMQKCEQIGESKHINQGGAGSSLSPQATVSVPGQPSVNQLGITGNPQYYGGNSVGNVPLVGQNGIGRAPPQHPKPDLDSHPQSHGNYFANNPDSRVYSAANGSGIYPKVEPGARVPVSASFQNPNSRGSHAPSNTYGQTNQPTYQQPRSTYTNIGPMGKNEIPATVIPIAALNPYQSRWQIKARVTNKKDLREYNNARGKGQVFSFDLLDSDGGEIQVTCFGEAAVTFSNQIEVGKVYLISRGVVKPASKNFSNIQNDYAIYLEKNSVVQLDRDDESIQKQQFHFSSISDIESMANNSIVDVIGVISSIYPTQDVTKKNGETTVKRTLQLRDMSGKGVDVTLWGDMCNSEEVQKLQSMCGSGVPPVLAIKAGRVNDFHGKSVGTYSVSQLFISPDSQKTVELREWFDREGRDAPFLSISRDNVGIGKTGLRKTISQIKDEGLGSSEKPDWITVQATISFIKADSFCYTACPNMVGERQCNKKVNNNGDGTWSCDKCGVPVPKCDYRYILQFQVQDHTGSTWVTAFQETGEEILGLPAEDLENLNQGDQDKFSSIIRGVLFTQYLFKLKVKEEKYNDEDRVKSTVVKAEKLNFTTEARFVLDLIDMAVAEDHNATNGGTPFVTPAKSIIQTGRDVAARANQVGHYGNQYNSMRGPANVTTGVSVLCDTCGNMGHNAQNCPSSNIRQGHQMFGGYDNRTPYGGNMTRGVAGNASSMYGNGSGHW